MRVGGANRIENTGIEQIDARVETIRALVPGCSTIVVTCPSRRRTPPYSPTSME